MPKALRNSLLGKLSGNRDLPLWKPQQPGRRTYNSQFGQDRWVIERVYQEAKFDGYFIEMGAADGLLFSNTLVLERKFSWNGLLIEPTSAFERLQKNRQASCAKAIVASQPKSIFIVEYPSPDLLRQGQVNTLRSIAVDTDSAAAARAEAARLLQKEGVWNELSDIEPTVHCEQAVTLENLLGQYRAPRTIDYLSLDVEGYEYEVLKNFPFQKYRFTCMTIERPPKKLHSLLTRNGYQAVAKAQGGDVFYVDQPMLASYLQGKE